MLNVEWPGMLLVKFQPLAGGNAVIGEITFVMVIVDWHSPGGSAVRSRGNRLGSGPRPAHDAVGCGSQPHQRAPGIPPAAIGPARLVESQRPLGLLYYG